VRQALFLLPDMALFLAICRMASAGVHRSRTSLFFFVCVWFLFSIATVVVEEAATPALYPKVYFQLLLFALGASAPAQWAAAQGMPRWGEAISLVAITAGIYLGPRFHWSLSPMPYLAAVGVLFICAAFHAEGQDRLLWGGVGLCLVLNGAGVLLARKFASGPAAYEWLALACAAIWIVMAWKIGPTPDAIVNPEKLALVPSARILFGLARSGRV
jgi:hypothetical protein